MSHPKTDAYLEELQSALELRDTSENQTADVIRQAKSHLLDSGEDPYEAFGAPAEYAKQYAPRSTTARFWVLVLGSVVLALVGGWLVANGVVNVVAETTMLWGLDPIVGIIVGALLILVWVASLVTVGVRHAKQSRGLGGRTPTNSTS